MRPLLIALVLFGLLAQAQRLTDVPAQDQAAIRAVIEAQIAAFKTDDAATAYSFAAPSIKKIFPNPQVFVEMVKSGYAQIYRPLKVEFGKVSKSGTSVVQMVKLIGVDGKKANAYYFMEKQPHGQWKIAGVQVEDVQEEAG